MSTIGNIASTLLHAVLPINLFPNNTTASSSSVTASSALGQQPDTGQLSSFAQLISTLQQLQQSNPAQYQQVTQQIAANLQTAAQSAQAGGNTAAATQLNQLATDFTNASASDQLPNLQDLAKAVGGGGHHQHFSGTASNALTQFLTSAQSGTSNSSLNAASIIQSALASAGIGTVGS
jgi:hypothetical protein